MTATLIKKMTWPPGLIPHSNPCLAQYWWHRNNKYLVNKGIHQLHGAGELISSKYHENETERRQCPGVIETVASGVT